MTDQLHPDPAVAPAQWRELRDQRGKLYARLDERRYLLEVRRNHETVTFDLRDYLDILRGVDHRHDIE